MLKKNSECLKKTQTLKYLNIDIYINAFARKRGSYAFQSKMAGAKEAFVPDFCTSSYLKRLCKTTEKVS